LTCGTVGEIEGWGYGFLLAGIGMVTGLIIFLITRKLGLLEDKAEPPVVTPAENGNGQPRTLSHLDFPIYGASLLLLPLVCFLIYQNDIMDYLLAAVGLVMIGYILYLSSQYPVVERQRLWVITILLIFTAVFWTFFELAGSALNVFTDNNVSKNLFGLTLKTSNFQAVNALFIMIFAPVFSVMWTYLAKKNIEPPAPIKFAIGLLLLGCGFLVLNLGVPMATEAMIPAMFLILLYLLHTLGELALSPVGLSLVTKLAPVKIVAFMMGFWFLSSSIAHQAGKLISTLTAVDENASKEESLTAAMKVFNEVGFVAIGSGVLLFLLTPIIKKWMHGIK
jgi:POT family proton-dependent oligopeptide transporter